MSVQSNCGRGKVLYLHRDNDKVNIVNKNNPLCR